jgi:hypothetical protein
MNISNYNYKKLTWMEIDAKLNRFNHPTEFSEESNGNPELSFEEVETAAYNADINIDIDLAYEAIKQGKELLNCVAEAQIEFCCG